MSRLRLGQPSMTNQFVAHDHLVQRPECLLRFTNFVEIMCPFFHVGLVWLRVGVALHEATAHRARFLGHTPTRTACTRTVVPPPPHHHHHHHHPRSLKWDRRCVAWQRDALGLLWDTVSPDHVKCGWGMDYAWAHELNYKNIGVVDACVGRGLLSPGRSLSPTSPQALPPLEPSSHPPCMVPLLLCVSCYRRPSAPPHTTPSICRSVCVVHTKAPAGLDALATNSFYKKYSIRPVAEMNDTLWRFHIRHRPPHEARPRVHTPDHPGSCLHPPRPPPSPLFDLPHSRIPRTRYRSTIYVAPSMGP
jgi:hypothetical protein